MNTTTQPAAELLLMDQCDGDIRISDVSVCGTSSYLKHGQLSVESPEKVRFLVQEIGEKIPSVSFRDRCFRLLSYRPYPLKASC